MDYDMFQTRNLRYCLNFQAYLLGIDVGSDSEEEEELQVILKNCFDIVSFFKFVNVAF